jgi:hypothetical protein
MTSSYNTFQTQAATYLGITGGTIASLQPTISTVLYMPTISGTSTITVNGATGYKNTIGQTWGTIDATLATAVASGRFTYSFPTSYYSQVPAVVYSVSGNDHASFAYTSGVDTATSGSTVAVVRSATSGAANLKISWMSQPSPTA